MDFKTGRPDHINDWLAGHRQGCWYGYSDNKNQVYANLIVLDGGSKPTESDVNNGLKAMQDAFDANDYSRKRIQEYPSVVDQLDQIYNEGIDAWKATIKTTKDKYPKP